ncbi:arginase [Rhodoferax sp. OV413]|uniref:arginase family protein n=1 Tax=Rhodoferax sp. OV413 TaxID=1855285 RepID=UPI00088DF33B|nr:arginase family protein [Rhodoferax sp. OV413]SDP55243.1 arginase [Rhodoferax sp. OV413]
MNNHLIVPFLMGQRRDGLCRLKELDEHTWDVLALSELHKTEIEDSYEKLRIMGSIYYGLSEKIKKLVGIGLVPISISGDCVSTLGVLAGLQKAGKQPDRILWLDAHGDFHTWKTSLTKYIGGMPLAMLVGRIDQHEKHRDAVESMLWEIGVTPYPEKRIILSDARDLDAGEKEALESSEITVCGVSDILKNLDSGESIYIHWDTDVVDAEAETPALKYHVKKGPKYSEIEALFKNISREKIVAISVSAWHEEKDLENKAAKACLRVLKSLEDILC